MTARVTIFATRRVVIAALTYALPPATIAKIRELGGKSSAPSVASLQ